jgi:hypothetical protein
MEMESRYAMLHPVEDQFITRYNQDGGDETESYPFNRR